MEKPLLVDELFDKWAPGVYRQEEFAQRPSEFATGVPVFIGVVPNAKPEAVGKAHRLHFWPQFKLSVGGNDNDYRDCMVAYAVRGFFQNDGKQCYVIPILQDSEALDQTLTADTLRQALEQSAVLDVDLVCVPDLGLLAAKDETATGKAEKDRTRRERLEHSLEQMVVKHCERMGDRFAILDSPRSASSDQVWEQWSAIDGKNGAIYYPWIRVRTFGEEHESERTIPVPPCGHVAGVYARTDHTRGVHKAPANEVLEGVVGLERHLTSVDQSYLNPKGVNCIRSFPGRGIRVWGARTLWGARGFPPDTSFSKSRSYTEAHSLSEVRALSGQDAWTYVNVRRLFLTTVRWIHWHLDDAAFEPNDPQLWARIERELNTYFMDLYRRGALKGNAPREAYYVKCDANTNPKEVREKGQVVTEIGLAPVKPYEFVVVRLIHGSSGVSISGPIRPEQN